MKTGMHNISPQKKLRLSRETLRRLSNQDLAGIVGGHITSAASACFAEEGPITAYCTTRCGGAGAQLPVTANCP